jgi:hypothetical protein
MRSRHPVGYFLLFPWVLSLAVLSLATSLATQTSSTDRLSVGERRAARLQHGIHASGWFAQV